MSTTLPSDLSLEELRALLQQARAAGIRFKAGKVDGRAHVLSPVTGVCTHCGIPPQAWRVVCQDLPAGGRFTEDHDARDRAMGRPMDALPARTGGRPLPEPAPRLRLGIPGRVGTGRECEYGCDLYAVSLRCEHHA